jgi:hypothetical protein
VTKVPLARNRFRGDHDSGPCRKWIADGLIFSLNAQLRRDRSLDGV